MDMTDNDLLDCVGYALNELTGAWQQCNCKDDDPSVKYFREAQRHIKEAEAKLIEIMKAIPD